MESVDRGADLNFQIACFFGAPKTQALNQRAFFRMSIQYIRKAKKTVESIVIMRSFYSIKIPGDSGVGK